MNSGIFWAYPWNILRGIEGAWVYKWASVAHLTTRASSSSLESKLEGDWTQGILYHGQNVKPFGIKSGSFSAPSCLRAHSEWAHHAGGWMMVGRISHGFGAMVLIWGHNASFFGTLCECRISSKMRERNRIHMHIVSCFVNWFGVSLTPTNLNLDTIDGGDLVHVKNVWSGR